MASLALYRKYRSQTFGDLVGQDHVVRTLKNSVATSRWSHAYLFTGPRGTGKTSTARLLAKALNCPNVQAGEPCGVCPVCESIADGSAMDVVEIDAASESGVDDVRRTIVETVDYRPTSLPRKIFIIDEVHDLSSKAFDALLKTIEEPPDHVVFVLATTEFGKVPPTIRSRCQRFEFHRGSPADRMSRLDHVVKAEGAEVEPAALTAIAKLADGGYRDALTLLEQAILTAEGRITLEHVERQLGLIPEEVADTLLTSIKAGDSRKTIDILEDGYRVGRDPRSVLEALLHRLSDLHRAALGLEDELLDPSQRMAIREQAGRFGERALAELRSGLAEAHRAIREVSLPKLWLEAELIRIAGRLQGPAAVPAQEAVPRISLAQELAAHRKQVESAPPPAPEPAAPSPIGEENGMEEAWRKVLGTLPKSKTAQDLLSPTKVLRHEAGLVTIGFPSTFDLDRFEGNDKLKRAVLMAWQQQSPGSQLVFVVDANRAKLAVLPEHTSVEYPLTGEELVAEARRLFESDKT